MYQRCTNGYPIDWRNPQKYHSFTSVPTVYQPDQEKKIFSTWSGIFFAIGEAEKIAVFMHYIRWRVKLLHGGASTQISRSTFELHIISYSTYDIIKLTREGIKHFLSTEAPTGSNAIAFLRKKYGIKCTVIDVLWHAQERAG